MRGICFGGTSQGPGTTEQTHGNRARLFGVRLQRSKCAAVENIGIDVSRDLQSTRELGAECFDPPIGKLCFEQLRRQIDSNFRHQEQSMFKNARRCSQSLCHSTCHAPHTSYFSFRKRGPNLAVLAVTIAEINSTVLQYSSLVERKRVIPS